MECLAIRRNTLIDLLSCRLVFGGDSFLHGRLLSRSLSRRICSLLLDLRLSLSHERDRDLVLDLIRPLLKHTKVAVSGEFGRKGFLSAARAQRDSPTPGAFLFLFVYFLRV